MLACEPRYVFPYKAGKTAFALVTACHLPSPSPMPVSLWIKIAFMKQLFLCALLIFFSSAASAQKKQKELPQYKRQIPAYKVGELMQRLRNTDTTYIVNFWATWCAPCIRELPEFETLQKKFAGTTTKVLLVSLDFKEEMAFRVPAFIDRRPVTPEVVWLNETDAEKFIPQIDNRWTGSMPATMIVSGPQRKKAFVERMVTADEIVEMLGER